MHLEQPNHANGPSHANSPNHADDQTLASAEHRPEKSLKPALLLAGGAMALGVIGGFTIYSDETPASSGPMLTQTQNAMATIFAPETTSEAAPETLRLIASVMTGDPAPKTIVAPSITRDKTGSFTSPIPAQAAPILRIALPHAKPATAIGAPLHFVPAAKPTLWSAIRKQAKLNPRAIPIEISAPIRIALDQIPIDRPPLPNLIAAPAIIPSNSKPRPLGRLILADTEHNAPQPPLRPDNQAPNLLATRETTGPMGQSVSNIKLPMARALVARPFAKQSPQKPAPRALDRRVDMDQISAPRPKNRTSIAQLQDGMNRAGKHRSLAAAIDSMQVGRPALPNFPDIQRAEFLGDAPTVLTLRRDGVSIGQIAVRMDQANQFEVQLSGLLDLAANQLPQADFTRLKSSGAAQKYVPFDHLRDLGIELDYDPVYDEIRLNG